jgi:hypothetical protein
MLPASGTALQEVASARAAIVLATIALVMYWRTVLRAFLVFLAIIVVVLVGAGAFELFNVAHV